MKTCPVCNKDFKNLGSHMKMHKEDPKERRRKDFDLRSRVITSGQAGLIWRGR